MGPRLPRRAGTCHREERGQLIDAVAQTTKSGFVYVFERETGRPLFPIVYRKAPASDVEGEVTAEMQPLPASPPPFARQMVTPGIVTTRTPEAHQAVWNN